MVSCLHCKGSGCGLGTRDPISVYLHCRLDGRGRGAGFALLYEFMNRDTLGWTR